jgi:hypothetical protein
VPLRRPRATSLDALLRRGLVREEYPGTAALVRRLAGVRARGWFTRAEFAAMCRWKSPRAQRLWETNAPARIRAVSRAVLATRSERRRMALLTGLRGVGVPIASAILTLIDPKRYGVLDIRCWQLLFALDEVGHNRRGQGFTIPQWETYLAALRHHARRLHVPARQIELTLFETHRKYQHGPLYHRSERGLRPRNPAVGSWSGGRQRGARREAGDERRKGGEAPLRATVAPSPRAGARAHARPSGSVRARRRPAAGRG